MSTNLKARINQAMTKKRHDDPSYFQPSAFRSAYDGPRLRGVSPTPERYAVTMSAQARRGLTQREKDDQVLQILLKPFIYSATARQPEPRPCAPAEQGRQDGQPEWDMEERGGGNQQCEPRVSGDSRLRARVEMLNEQFSKMTLAGWMRPRADEPAAVEVRPTEAAAQDDLSQPQDWLSSRYSAVYQRERREARSELQPQPPSVPFE